jgi:hypothetical protein
MTRARTTLVVALILAAAPASRLAGQSSDGAADGALPTLVAPARALVALDVPIDRDVAPSPNGEFIAVLQTRPDPVLWFVPTDGSPPFPLRKMWAAYRPRWSPSGARIGFIAAIGPPRVWTVEIDPETGRPIDPPRLLIRTPANAFAFSPDGERIALVSSRSTAAGASTIQLVDWETRRVRTLRREDGAVYRIDWSPDGAFLYYGLVPAEGGPAHRIVRARVADGAAVAVLAVGEFLGLSPDGAYLMYRPAGPNPCGLVYGACQIVELATAAGEPVVRLALPAGAAPRWGARSSTLLQVRPGPTGDAIWAIEIPPAP